MSGETEATPSAWTIDSLHSQVEVLLEERARRFEVEIGGVRDSISEHDRRYEQRFEA
jgi:hypothetical protein